MDRETEVLLHFLDGDERIVELECFTGRGSDACIPGHGM